MGGNINSAYQWAIRTCNAPNVGYSKNYRYQQWYDGAIRYDCSSFIWYALKNGGFTDIGSSAFTTATEPTYLLATGFAEVPITGEWKAGDILWRRRGELGHTEMVYTGGVGSGVSMGAHTDTVALENQVSISSKTTTASAWMKLYRYGGGASGGGISIYVIAAMCGCWWTESGINPAVWESLIPCAWDYEYEYNNKGGYGLGQWTNIGTPHGRCYDLYHWMTSNGYQMDDGNGELQYVIVEDYWVNSSHKRGSYNNLTGFLSSTSTDIATLVWDFLACWEGVAGNAYDARVNQANQCLQYIREHMSDDPSQYSWITGNRYLSTSERLNNALCVYFYYNGYNIDPDPSDKDKKRSMPVWMMCKYHL